MIFTSFGHVDLSTAIGLETVRHHGPSFIGIDTLFMSKGEIPEVFLKGCGVPESFKDSEVLFPIRLDNNVFDGWNHHRKADVIAKYIGDFRDWRNAGSYSKALARLVADLKA